MGKEWEEGKKIYESPHAKRAQKGPFFSKTSFWTNTIPHAAKNTGKQSVCKSLS